MKKNMLKICATLLMVVLVISVSISSFALTPSNITGTDSANGTAGITNIGNSIVGILQAVGIVLSVVVLIVLGIKYMMGSAEEKAEYKKTMIPYIVGAVLIFAASALAQVVFDFVSGITTTA